MLGGDYLFLFLILTRFFEIQNSRVCLGSCKRKRILSGLLDMTMKPGDTAGLWFPVKCGIFSIWSDWVMIQQIMGEHRQWDIVREYLIIWIVSWIVKYLFSQIGRFELKLGDSQVGEKHMVIFALRKNCRKYLQNFLQSTKFFAKNYGKKYVKKFELLYELSWAFPRRTATVWRMIARVHMFDILMFVRFTLIMLQTLTIDSQEHRGHQSSGAQAPEL